MFVPKYINIHLCVCVNFLVYIHTSLIGFSKEKKTFFCIFISHSWWVLGQDFGHNGCCSVNFLEHTTRSSIRNLANHNQLAIFITISYGYAHWNRQVVNRGTGEHYMLVTELNRYWTIWFSGNVNFSLWVADVNIRVVTDSSDNLSRTFEFIIHLSSFKAIFFSVTQRPNSGLGRLTVEVSSSHTDTHSR
jgi:hypothetical protein